MISDQQIEGWLARALAKTEKVFGFAAALHDTKEHQGASSVAPAKIPPGQVIGLHVLTCSATTVVLAWKPPLTGSLPIRFTVFMRVHNAPYWNIGAFSGDSFATVDGLTAGVLYDFEIMAHNN